ncbi:MAG: META domain-containing protein, partial [Thermoplasmata archaeon]|nr:META domain-containing protein [Thermoplasmata archaeon]
FRIDGRLGGTAGCNRYTATYRAGDGSLTVDPQMASTRMWCGEPEGAMEQEVAFLRAWSRVARFDAREDRLVLSDAEGATLLEFVLAG